MQHKIPSLETARLLLRPMELADVPQVQTIFPRGEIVKYLNGKVPWPYPAKGAETFFRDRQNYFGKKKK
jgi:RimJ/RimL family protein N-acetyltransferase